MGELELQKTAGRGAPRFDQLAPFHVGPAVTLTVPFDLEGNRYVGMVESCQITVCICIKSDLGRIDFVLWRAIWVYLVGVYGTWRGAGSNGKSVNIDGPDEKAC